MIQVLNQYSGIGVPISCQLLVHMYDLADSHYAAQYNAWCKNNGTHYTENRGHVRWNMEIIWKMRTELELAWDMLQEDIPGLFDGLASSLREALTMFKIVVESKSSTSCKAGFLGKSL